MVDITWLGQPIEKLIDVVSKGIGIAYKPRAIRKEADAEAYKVEVLAQAEARKIQIEGDAKIDLVLRARDRLANQEINRQTNLEEIAEKSIKYLGTSVSEKSVDEDWRTRFFNKAQDITGDEMQEIWAKILASEVSEPGLISLRTLEIVSNISKSEAEKFEVACSLATQKSWIWKIGHDSALDNFWLNYSSLMVLRDAGLLHESDQLAKVLLINPEHLSIHHIGDKTYQLITHNPTTRLSFPQIAFTKAGQELCRLIDTPLNEEYLKKIVDLRTSEWLELIPFSLI